MRILQVIPFFSPEMGGSAEVVYQISRGLAARGHKVTVVTSNYALDKARFPDIAFDVIYLRNAVARWGFYLTPELIPWARRQVADFDIIHMHTTRTFQNLVVGHFARRRGIPYVLSAHGTLPIIGERQLPKRGYDLLFGRRLLSGIHGLIAVTPMEEKQYIQVGMEPDRIRVIYNGLDLTEYIPQPQPGIFRARLEIGPDTPLILFVGRVHKLKGIDNLLHAFSQLRTQQPAVRLAIVGPDAGELAKLKELTASLRLEHAVQFVGPLYGTEKLSAYAEADVVAVPSAYEIFGLVPFEALMCGTTVVVTDGNGAAQIVADAKAGCLVPYEDPSALSTALAHVLSHQEEAVEMVRNGQIYVRQRLNWQTSVQAVEQFYDDVIHSKTDERKGCSAEATAWT